MNFSEFLHDGLAGGGLLKYGTATGGDTTSIIDTARAALGEQQATFRFGTAFIRRDAGGSGAAPEGEMSEISDYAPGDGDFTLTSTLTAAVASGDRYAVSEPVVGHDELIQLGNDALKMLGPLAFSDTSIATATAQTEYALPIAAKRRRPIAVWVQTKLNDANDNRWSKIYDWDITFSAGGSTALLILPQMASGYTVKLDYFGVHPTLNDWDDQVSEYIEPELAKRALVYMLADRITEGGKNAVPIFRVSFEKASQLYEDAKRMYPIHRPQSTARLNIVNGLGYNDPGEPGKVSL